MSNRISTVAFAIGSSPRATSREETLNHSHRNNGNASATALIRFLECPAFLDDRVLVIDVNIVLPSCTRNKTSVKFITRLTVWESICFMTRKVFIRGHQFS